MCVDIVIIKFITIVSMFGWSWHSILLLLLPLFLVHAYFWGIELMIYASLLLVTSMVGWPFHAIDRQWSLFGHTCIHRRMRQMWMRSRRLPPKLANIAHSTQKKKKTNRNHMLWRACNSISIPARMPSLLLKTATNMPLKMRVYKWEIETCFNFATLK